MSSVTPELAEETDADLLVYMSMADEEPEAAREAWAEFYQRHAGYLYGVCLSAYASLVGGEEGVADLVASALTRAFERAETFDAGGLTDPNTIRVRTRAWLGRVAERLVKTMLRHRYNLPTVFLEHEHWQDIPEVGALPFPEETRQRVTLAAKALRSGEILNNREEEVIRITLQWYRTEKDYQRLPDEVAADLAAALRITPENLRTIRSRALRKIRTFITQGLGNG